MTTSRFHPLPALFVVSALSAPTAACAPAGPPAQKVPPSPPVTSVPAAAPDGGRAAADGDAVTAFASGALRLRGEALRDDLVHFELGPVFAASTGRGAIPVTPMIARHDAPTAWKKRTATTLETAELRVEVDPASLCVKVTDIARGFL